MNAKRYTVVLQVCEVNDEGDVVECLDTLGPTLASTDLEGVKQVAALLERDAPGLFIQSVAYGTITPLFPRSST